MQETNKPMELETKEFLYFMTSLDETIEFIEKYETTLISYGIDIVEIGKTKRFITIDNGKQIVRPGYWFIWAIAYRDNLWVDYSLPDRVYVDDEVGNQLLGENGDRQIQLKKRPRIIYGDTVDIIRYKDIKTLKHERAEIFNKFSRVEQDRKDTTKVEIQIVQ